MDRETKRSISLSLLINAALFGALGLLSFGGCHASPKEEIIPVDFLVVTEENAADRLAEEPNEATEPPNEPEPEPAKPDPIPEPDLLPPPLPDPDPIPPPKPEKKTEPKPEKKQEKKQEKTPEKKKAEKKPIVIKKGERVGPVTQGKKDRTKAATAKKLSDDEIRRLLGAGAKAGNRNQIPPNETSRCYGRIRDTFRAQCEEYGVEASPTGRAPVLSITFGSGGSVRSLRLSKSSGDAAFDAQVLQACRSARRVSGLSADFLSHYPTVELQIIVR